MSELLGGEREDAAVVPAAVEDVVLDTVAYAETARRRNGGWRFWTFVAFTALCLIAVLALFIIYLSTNRNTYVMLAIRCVALGWAVCYPLLRWERYPVRGVLHRLPSAGTDMAGRRVELPAGDAPDLCHKRHSAIQRH